MPYLTERKEKIMSKENEKKEIVDPIVLAAMIEDDNEDDEEKELRKQILGDDTSNSSDDEKDEDDKDEEEEKEGEEQKSDKSGDKDEKDEEDEDEEEKKEETEPKKPIEAEDDPNNEEDEEEEKYKSRKKRRQERQEDFLTSIRKDNNKNINRADIPEYKPLDYGSIPKDENGEEREFKPEELVQDREMFGAVQFAQGANRVREAAEQDKFWDDLSTESKILSFDPKLNFLSEVTSDGKNNPNFDADKAEEVNAMYLQLCGAETFQARNQQGQPLFNNQTGQPVMMVRVRDTGISYEKFARNYVDRMEKWADDYAENRVEQTRDNVTKQRKLQSVRPGSGKRKTLGAIKLGDISNMTDEELEANEAEIDRQIDAMMGL